MRIKDFFKQEKHTTFLKKKQILVQHMGEKIWLPHWVVSNGYFQAKSVYPEGDEWVEINKSYPLNQFQSYSLFV